MRRRGIKGSGIQRYVKAAKDWIIWNDIEPPMSVGIYGASDYNKYENEVPPTRHGLRRSSTWPTSSTGSTA